jgi:hypothetical protein
MRDTFRPKYERNARTRIRTAQAYPRIPSGIPQDTLWHTPGISLDPARRLRWLRNIRLDRQIEVNKATRGSAEQIFAGATAALRDGMRERRRREWPIPFASSLTMQTARKAPSHKGCGKIGRDRVGRSSLFRRKMRPRSGLWAPQQYLGAVWHSRRCPIPALRGPSGYALGSPGVALLGLVVPATTFVARLMIIPILPATRPARICSALP